MFRGSFVAIVTPFKNGRIDEKAFRALIEFHLKNGTDGIVPAGCTGEAATLDHAEQKRLIDMTLETVNKRVPVIAGTGSNCTEEALDLTKYADRAGCKGALIITPYYNKPTPEGLFRHYQTIAKAVNIPIMLYNVPSRTGVSINPETVARLSKIDNIVAIKEASGSLNQVSQILSMCDITVFSGDDSLTLPMLSVGAEGVVSVAANVVPNKMSKMVKLFLGGDIRAARKLHHELLPLFTGLFLETNPIPVKAALGIMQMIHPEWRMPLCAPKQSTIDRLREILKNQKLIKR